MILQSNDTEIKKLPSCDNCSVTMDTGRFLKIQDHENRRATSPGSEKGASSAKMKKTMMNVVELQNC